MDKKIREINYEKDEIHCKLCGRWMKIPMYELHYGRCFDIEYLLSVAKQKGEQFTRQDLENCKQEVIDKLLLKYPPEMTVESLLKKWKMPSNI